MWRCRISTSSLSVVCPGSVRLYLLAPPVDENILYLPCLLLVAQRSGNQDHCCCEQLPHFCHSPADQQCCPRDKLAYPPCPAFRDSDFLKCNPNFFRFSGAPPLSSFARFLVCFDPQLCHLFPTNSFAREIVGSFRKIMLTRELNTLSEPDGTIDVAFETTS